MSKISEPQKENSKGQVIRRIKLVAGIFFIFLGLLLFINFIPALQLKEPHMRCYNGSYVKVYYERQKDAAKDVFLLTEAKAPELIKTLDIKPGQKIKIYIYDNQKTMQCKKYGYLALFLHLDWYIGDNIRTKVILTSPANPGKVHTYEENKQAVLHEMVHAYISTINPDIRLWLTEGMALYLANREPFYKAYLKEMKVPDFKATRTGNPVKFSNMGGYTFSSTYIEYLKQEYGWDRVKKLIKTEDWEKALGKSEKEIYQDWVQYLMNYYQ